jgi:MoaA/NifB/PqqE/SkfB family radical SAM enzyme
MDPALVRSIIDQCHALGIKTIVLHHVNEPLLHPNIFDILLYLEEHGMTAVLSTNANEMKSVLLRASRQNLLPKQLNLRYSIDAGTPETYNEIRRGGDFDTVLGGLAAMADFCRDRGIALQTGSNYVMTKKSIYELATFADRFDAFIPLDQMYFSFVNGNTPTGLNKYIIDNRVTDFVRRTPCDVPFNQLNILRDGRVSLCCVDFNEEAIVGDIRKQSIGDIWSGPKLDHHRRALGGQDVASSHAICQRCYFAEAGFTDPNPAIQQMFKLKASGIPITNEHIVSRIRFDLMSHGLDLKFSPEPLVLHDTSDAFLRSLPK